MGYFDSEGADENSKQYIPPDYSNEGVGDIDGKADPEEPSFDEDLEDEFSEDEDIGLDEGSQETILDTISKQEKEEKPMTTSPFMPASSGWGTSQPSWGSQTPANPWQPVKPNQTWGVGSGNSNPWQSGGTAWGSSQSQKQEINRSKKVVFCDFLDCLAETYQSNGQPGLRPRDIYDLKPRLDVWQKIAAIGPERVFALIPEHIMPASANGAQGMQITLSYFCCSLSAFLKIPFDNCQVLAQVQIGQSKAEIIRSALENPMNKITKEDSIMIGIYSGLYGLSNVDAEAARICGIDYVDLSQLLNSL